MSFSFFLFFCPKDNVFKRLKRNPYTSCVHDKMSRHLLLFKMCYDFWGSQIVAAMTKGYVCSTSTWIVYSLAADHRSSSHPSLAFRLQPSLLAHPSCSVPLWSPHPMCVLISVCLLQTGSSVRVGNQICLVPLFSLLFWIDSMNISQVKEWLNECHTATK